MPFGICVYCKGPSNGWWCDNCGDLRNHNNILVNKK